MATGRALIPHRNNAFLSVCLVLLFSLLANVNILDNLNHIAEPDHHEHSALSLIDIEHHDAGIDSDHQDPNKDDHSHPSLCGGVALCAPKVHESLVIYAVTLKLPLASYEQLSSLLMPGFERPPKLSL